MSLLRRLAPLVMSPWLFLACRSEAPRPMPEPSATSTVAETRATAATSLATRASTTLPEATAEADASTSTGPRRSAAREVTWRWKDSPVGPMTVVLSIPETDEPLPVLIAMHGLGESRKGPEAGARGWLDDYHLERALERVADPPLTSADYQRLGGSPRRQALGAALEERPYRGLILVMPYTPDILEPDRSLDGAQALGDFLVKELLPRVRSETPALAETRATGIDGVSLGGRAALLVGLAHPDVFGVVGSLQAAIYPHEIGELTDRVAAAKKANPSLVLRLLTSSGDFYRGALGTLSEALEARDLDHGFLVVEGPHSYAFNRGPGAYELLTFHDRALRGEGPIERR